MLVVLAESAWGLVRASVRGELAGVQAVLGMSYSSCSDGRGLLQWFIEERSDA